MVFFMVLVGGITRLTDSGLSMVEWRPLLGTIPPMNHVEWLRVFEKYQQFPEYQKINQGMSLSEFKMIFYWEYSHRVLGRLVGMVFLFPYLFFFFKKMISKSLNRKLIVAFVLGGMQGLMGWYMVKSGLVNRPDVSHYRLAAHLLLAFLIIGYIFWIIFGLTQNEKVIKVKTKTYKMLVVFSIIVGFQFLYGAFVAGLDAGVGYNTFPKMGSKWIADAVFHTKPLWLNFLENPATVQFAHRVMGIVIFVFGGGFLIIALRFKDSSPASRSLYWLAAMVFIQFLLGILTLIFIVPISYASMHQVGAVVLLILLLRSLYLFNPRKLI